MDMSHRISSFALQNRIKYNFCTAGAPKILEDLKDIKVAPHGQVSLKVDAVGEGSLTYVWQRRVENSTEWKAVPSETKYQGQGTASLVVASVEERDVGLFRCLVFSDGGQCVTKEALLRIGWFSHTKYMPLKLSEAHFLICCCREFNTSSVAAD